MIRMLRRLALLLIVTLLASPVLAGDGARSRVVVRTERATQLAELLLDGDRDPSDKNGHGTAVAGVIVAKGSTEDGFAPRGVAPGAKILSIKVMDDRGAGDLATLARGIVRAVDRNARIVLVSAGV